MKPIKLFMLVLGALLLLSSLSISDVSFAQESLHPFQVVTNVRYYDGIDAHERKHLMDIYSPQGLENTPVLIFAHGGAWTEGDKQIYFYIGQAFAKRGITTAIINYRLTPEVQHPGHIQDVARAFSWVYANIADFGGNPGRIFLTGHSAGGHLVSLLALNERFLEAEGLSTELIQGVIPFSGVYNILGDDLDVVFTADLNARQDASPQFHVDDEQPPFLLIYAEFDFPELIEQAKDLQFLLQRSGTPSETLIIPNKDHITIVGHIGLEGDLTTNAIADFIHERTEAP